VAEDPVKVTVEYPLLKSPLLWQWHSHKEEIAFTQGSGADLKKEPGWLPEFRSLRGSGCRLGIGCTPFSSRFHRSPGVRSARACFLPTETQGTDQGVERSANEPGLAEEQLLQTPRHRHQRVFDVHLLRRSAAACGMRVAFNPASVWSARIRFSVNSTKWATIPVCELKLVAS
jgi:hypothetical protein